jgi:hypothetical protein
MQEKKKPGTTVYAATPPKKNIKNKKQKFGVSFWPSSMSLIVGSPLMRDKAARLIHVDTSLSQDTA